MQAGSGGVHPTHEPWGITAAAPCGLFWIWIVANTSRLAHGTILVLEAGDVMLSFGRIVTAACWV